MSTSAAKADVFRSLLGQAVAVNVWLDARRPGVMLPKRYAADPSLMLHYGFSLPIPIPDLEVDDLGISGTLSFDRTACVTFVPWSAVFAIGIAGADRGVVFEDALPFEVVETARSLAIKSAVNPDTAVANAAPPRPRFSLVPDESTDGQAPVTVEQQPAPAIEPERVRPALRIVRGE